MSSSGEAVPALLNDARLRHRFGASEIARRRPQAIPFSITVTINEVLEVAADADLRAEILEHSMGRVPTSPILLRKVDSLHETARELRRNAADLADRWAVPK